MPPMESGHPPGPPDKRRSPRSLQPSLQWERVLWRSGIRAVAGIDEVGRGPLAGPLVAAAVVLPPSPKRVPWLRDVRDSKLLTPARREALDPLIRSLAIAVGIGTVSAAALDAIGVAEATRRAMSDALDQLQLQVEHLLIDALSLPHQVPQTPLIHGDARCVSIACASIVAKVARDRMMDDLDPTFPGYGFSQNKGYGTSQHLSALEQLGPCPIHRRSFAPLRLSREIDA
jgi:ribonuclease HII